ncbi:MAG: DUF4389 domain-containing protein [Dehalococcoidia bacterium]|nr:DUF4389 domain-containing protein [Dehalococcoidia bacterium]
MMTAAEPWPAPHPVAFDVAYPERLSRGLIFVKWLLAIPQLIVIYLLLIVAELLAVISWFAILFTGRYPKSFFEFSSGVLRWQANVMAYVFLLRDEYPPFSWEPGGYPLLLTIPPAERQSRFRLFVRILAFVPNQIALQFVILGALFTTFIAWWAILLTGRYPRGLFRFAVGVMRWQDRLWCYLFLLRDEFPPYSINAAARPGNEVLSAIVATPLVAAYIAFSAVPFFGALGGGGSTVHVSRQALAAQGTFAPAPPSADSGNVRLTLLGYGDAATAPVDGGAAFDAADRFVRFEVSVGKTGFWPTFYSAQSFTLYDCAANLYGVDAIDGTRFRIVFRGGSSTSEIYFRLPRSERPCELRYGFGPSQVRFVFDGP